jgi:hypothetical protein
MASGDPLITLSRVGLSGPAMENFHLQLRTQAASHRGRAEQQYRAAKANEFRASEVAQKIAPLPRSVGQRNEATPDLVINSH